MQATVHCKEHKDISKLVENLLETIKSILILLLQQVLTQSRKYRHDTAMNSLGIPDTIMDVWSFLLPTAGYMSASALVWVCPLEQLDYDHYLPMFFDGIRCLQEPCTTLARQV